MFLLVVYTRKKFGEISKSQSLFSFRGERRFRDSTLERRFLPFRNKRVESMRSPHYLAERSELTQQGRRSESKVRDGVKKRVGRRKRGSKKKKGFSFFSKESFPSLSLAARLGILSSSLRRGNVNFLLSLADPLRRRLLSFGFSSSWIFGWTRALTRFPFVTRKMRSVFNSFIRWSSENTPILSSIRSNVVKTPRVINDYIYRLVFVSCFLVIRHSFRWILRWIGISVVMDDLVCGWLQEQSIRKAWIKRVCEKFVKVSMCSI